MASRFNSVLKTALLSVLLISAVPSFAQDSEISSVYAQLDEAFASRSTEKINAILSSNNKSDYYRYYESYTLKKTRQLIIENDLEFARQASLSVIDNNIENFDAVDLYSYIDRAILSEQAARQAEENRLRLEQERQALLAEKTRQKIEKSNVYQTVSTASGKSVYINEEQQSFSTLNWAIQLGIVDLVFQNVTDPAPYSSIKYGLCLGGDLFYKADQYVLGMDLFADFQMLTMGKGEQEFMVSGRLIPELAFASLSKSLFLRFGFGAYALASDVKDKTGSVGTFMSPVVGIGFDNFALGNGSLALHADYLPGHFAYEGLKASFEMGGEVTFPLTINERTKIGLMLGVSDLLFLKDNGIDNRCKVLFGIGVGNVSK